MQSRKCLKEVNLGNRDYKSITWKRLAIHNKYTYCYILTITTSYIVHKKKGLNKIIALCCLKYVLKVLCINWHDRYSISLNFVISTGNIWKTSRIIFIWNHGLTKHTILMLLYIYINNIDNVITCTKDFAKLYISW